MGLEPEVFYKQLQANDILFFTGVPDSILKDFCSYVANNTKSENNIIAANEGNAIALAAGYYLSTNKIPLVYMQNSGLGNAINPLLSLVHKSVYKIPMLLLIGWRGAPGESDECQHIKQGSITLDLLNLMDIPYSILTKDKYQSEEIVKKASDYIKNNCTPYAIVVKKGIFSSYKFDQPTNNEFELSREEAIKIIISQLEEDDIVVSSTGNISREVYEIRNQFKQTHERDFLMVGSMGHASQIAMTIAMQKTDRDVYCLEGDGALIMHLGGLTTIGQKNVNNFRHIILNNGAHDSVGGQPTVGLNIQFEQLCMGVGYKGYLKAETRAELIYCLEKLKTNQGPLLLEVRVKKGARKNLGRPKIDSLERKKQFMKFLDKR